MVDDITPETDGLPSGRFVLRIDPELHALLRGAAHAAGLSLNEYCTRKLALPAGDLSGPGVGVVLRAAGLFGDRLLGVIAFGSWAREELSDSSDIDVLVVVDAGSEITRETYRAWDLEPVVWQGRPVEAHFVHLPEDVHRLSGVWAEVAVEGVILFERGSALSRRLVAMRRQIIAGRMLRRRAHGQSYWVREG
jgi:predicted nucleotidyltransferase